MNPLPTSALLFADLNLRQLLVNVIVNASKAATAMASLGITINRTGISITVSLR
jgi:phosphoglycerate-specific signal transduction histidine kinase